MTLFSLRLEVRPRVGHNRDRAIYAIPALRAPATSRSARQRPPPLPARLRCSCNARPIPVMRDTVPAARVHTVDRDSCRSCYYSDAPTLLIHWSYSLGGREFSRLIVSASRLWFCFGARLWARGRNIRTRARAASRSVQDGDVCSDPLCGCPCCRALMGGGHEPRPKGEP